MNGNTDNWETHWQRYADSASLNPAQAYRRVISLDLLGLSDGSKLLDIGSGQGDFARMVFERHPVGIAYRGLELSASAVAMSREKAPQGEFLACDLLENPPELDGWAGWATHALCSEVLEHVDDPVSLLRTASTCLSSGGRLVVTVPGGPMSAFDRHIGHRTHYTVESLRQVMDASGFEPLEVIGAGWPFFNLYRLTVIARGERLITDVESAGPGREVSGAAKLAMGVFGFFFRMNVLRSPWGWQMIAVGKKR